MEWKQILWSRSSVVICLLFPITLYCQSQPQLIGYHLQKTKAKISFELVNNLIVIKGKLNKHENLSFIVDTGSSVSVIFTDDSVNVDKTNKYLTIRGFGKEDSIRAPISIYNTLAFKNVMAYNQSVIAVDKNDFSLDEAAGETINGIVGHDFFAAHQVTINFITKKMVLKKFKQHALPEKRWLRLPIRIEKHVPILDTQVSIANGDPVTMPLILDTGADVPIVINLKSYPKTAAVSTIGYGLMGHTSGYITRISTLQMGKIALHNIYAAIPASNYSNSQPGNLGSALFQQNKIRFNYAEKAFFIRYPNRIKKQSLSYDRSGLSLVKKTGPSGQLTIDFISPNSLAEQVGLQVGDQITAIEKISYPQLTLGKARELLTDMRHKKLRIVYKRNGNSYDIELPLADFH